MAFGNATLDAYNGNLVALFKMDEAAGNLTDCVQGIVATKSGSPTYRETGVIDYAVRFPVGSHYFVTPEEASFPSGDFTWSAWIKRSGQVRVFAFDATGVEYSLTVANAYVRWWRVEPAQIFAVTDGFLTDGAWDHLALTRTAGSHQFYINGAAANMTVNGADATSLANTALYLGRAEDGDYYFVGDLDQLILWNTAISGAAINALYNADAGLWYCPEVVETLRPYCVPARRYRWPGDAQVIGGPPLLRCPALEWARLAAGGATTLHVRRTVSVGMPSNADVLNRLRFAWDGA